MSPPIELCVGGHSICAPCRAMAANCPLCYRRLTSTRDFLLEAVYHEMVHVPCPNHGCDVRAVGREVADHAAVCPLRDYACPVVVIGCPWRGPRSEVRRHAARSHPRHLLEGTSLTSTLRPGEVSSSRELLDAHGEIFVATRDVCRDLSGFAVQLLGPVDRCRGFAYEVRLGVGADPGPTATFSFPVREDTVTFDELLRERACVCIDTAFLGNFARDGVVRYELLVKDVHSPGRIFAINDV